MIDILAVQEARLNKSSLEVHDGYMLRFSADATRAQKSRANQKREQHRLQPQQSLTELELCNPDAEEHGGGIVYSFPQLARYKGHVQQIHGRKGARNFQHP